MPHAHPGDTVTISYIGTLDNGRIFDSTDEHGPLTFTLGAGGVFPALEQAIIGMRPGETKNVVLAAERAYGPRHRENIFKLSRQAFPADKPIVAGQKLSIEFADGASKEVRIVAADDTEVTLDGNHPLAGCDLTFALRVDRIA